MDPSFLIFCTHTCSSMSVWKIHVRNWDGHVWDLIDGGILINYLRFFLKGGTLLFVKSWFLLLTKLSKKIPVYAWLSLSIICTYVHTHVLCTIYYVCLYSVGQLFCNVLIEVLFLIKEILHRWFQCVRTWQGVGLTYVYTHTSSSPSHG